jgi:hypothetical protein
MDNSFWVWLCGRYINLQKWKVLSNLLSYFYISCFWKQKSRVMTCENLKVPFRLIENLLIPVIWRNNSEHSEVLKSHRARESEWEVLSMFLLASKSRKVVLRKCLLHALFVLKIIERERIHETCTILVIYLVCGNVVIVCEITHNSRRWRVSRCKHFDYFFLAFKIIMNKVILRSMSYCYSRIVSSPLHKN